ncbi:L-idonate 5-dehydrogenase [Paracoccus halophilus]|uniref:L-idonate 5-dehydrogenase n=1 Tax=Paracoccus halophilus TaxID=376733 RepID=A0A099F8Y8_9RHOB|nr:L-idonate 5-dehydrogenase [Paracoccus halophilus]KGJ06517.1 phosphoesterase [Paracoccus halophilus]SFA37870.1 L-idonate 5-dehydrogenase [Paracoccus halophilus]
MTQNIACRLHAAHDLRLENLPEPEAQQGAALIRVQRGGICGSDLHYYHDGGFGPVRVREPIILGHEAAGVVEAAPEGSGLRVGQLVSLSPSRPCGTCEFCAAGQERHCLNMRFNGSAMRLPHENGFFRNRLYHPVAQCLPLPEGVSAHDAAGAEPLSVCLHALNMAPALAGQRVLVTGAGPIGAICTALARLRGAAEIVVTDVQDFTLDIARRMGADRVVNVAGNPDGLAEYATGKGRIDVVLECSANPHAIAQAIGVARPQATLVQIGVGGTMPLPLNLIVAKELRFVGTHRFDAEFAEAVRMIGAGEIDLSPMVTHVLPAHDAVRAFDLAGDRRQAVKVQLDFAG